jgi:transcription initiation factor TFIID TATA-box-binding protein
MPRPKFAEVSFASWDELWGEALVSKATCDVPIPHVTVDNVVATFKLADAIDLEHCARALYFLEYNCSKFTAATLRLRSPATTALTFSSGSVVCTGAKSVELARAAADIYVEIFKPVVPEAACSAFKIQNLVGNAKCPFTVDLTGVVKAFSANATFSIDIFPGLVFRFDNPKIVFLVFRSGSVVITGAREMKTVHMMFARFFKHVLYPFKDTSTHAHISNSSEYKELLTKRKRF